MQTKLFHATRSVDDHGETLVVRNVGGAHFLTDACDKNVVVVVPSGRHAKLIGFSFEEFSNGRDAHVFVFESEAGLGFAHVEHFRLRVLIQDLSEGQLVDVLPSAEPAAIYAFLPRPIPVLFGVASAEPVYAYA